MAHELDCNCPPPEEVFARVDRAIDAGGWHMIWVDSLGEGPCWGYTIGLTERFGHPEFIVLDACDCCAARILWAAAEQVAAGDPRSVPSPEPVVLGGSYAYHFRRVDPAHWQDGWFATWRGYYDSKPWAPPRPAAVQIVHGDADGRFPWDPGCDPTVRRGQAILLGPRRVRANHPNRRTRRRRRR